MRNDVTCQFDFRRARQRMAAIVVNQGDLVVIAAKGVLCAVGHQQRNSLAFALGLGVLKYIVAFGGKTDAKRWLRPL